MVIDDKIDAVEESAKIMGLHIHHGDSVECVKLFGGDDFDLNVEQMQHALVFLAW